MLSLKILRYCLFCFLTAFFMNLCIFSCVYPQYKKTEALERRVGELEKELARLKKEVDFYNLTNLPEHLTLCEKKISLKRDDLRERFEREMLQFLENKGLLVILIKRYFKYYNVINDEIKKFGLPSDLIFLVLAESYLNPRALSKAEAAGLWQFIKETGKKEGLFINDHIDERYNIKKSTRSALMHLKKLNEEFNDWFITMAAYNAGAARLREAISNQGTRDFFDLFLPEEAERYIFRIISLKEIVLNREKYGIRIDENSLYKPVILKEIMIEIEKETHISVFAKAMDVSFKVFRDANLHLRRYRLPKGVYTINVLGDKYSVFMKNIKEYPHICILREK